MASIRASYPRATVDEVRSRPKLTVVGAGGACLFFQYAKGVCPSHSGPTPHPTRPLTPCYLILSDISTVIGLTVANELCEHGFDVEIIARDMPFDETSSMQWASPWAVSEAAPLLYSKCSSSYSIVPYPVVSIYRVRIGVLMPTRA